MPEETTLLAHLVPKITSRVEDTATDSMAFLLNRSEDCRRALNQLLQEGDPNLEPLVRFQTQVTYTDGSRPDMNGYDANDRKRLLVESKFWHSLGQGQASGYLKQLNESGPGVLMFIAPDKRIDTLWHSILRQLEAEAEGLSLDLQRSSDRLRRAQVIKLDRQVMLVSWTVLLDRFATAASGDVALVQEIQQLRGLAQMQDTEAFLPIRPEEFSPEIPRRIRVLNRLIDTVIDGRLVPDGWISVERRKATPQRNGYGRYFRSVGGDGKPASGDFFLCVNIRLWATRADTPIWLWISRRVAVEAVKLRSLATPVVEDDQRGPFYVPIYLPVGVEQQQVIDSVVSQAEAIIGACRPLHPKLQITPGG